MGCASAYFAQSAAVAGQARIRTAPAKAAPSPAPTGARPARGHGIAELAARFPPGQSAANAPVGEPFRFDESAPRRPMSAREMNALLKQLAD